MFRLVQTCGACPEQYDVYLAFDPDDGGESTTPIGYMRLRHGYFYAEHLDVTVYEANTDGDGMFTDDERENHLNLACHAIKRSIEQGEEDEPDLIYKVEQMGYSDDGWYPYEN